MEARVNADGRGHLFCGRAADTDSNDRKFIFESIIAGNLAAFLAIMSALYEAAGYHGQVDSVLSQSGCATGLAQRNSGGV